jgi:hypothetical protein
MAKDGTRSGPQQRSPQLGPAGRRSGERRVDTATHNLPAPGAHLAVNRLGGHTDGRRLANRDDAILVFQQPPDLTRQFRSHDSSVQATLALKEGPCGPCG